MADVQNTERTTLLDCVKELMKQLSNPPLLEAILPESEAQANGDWSELGRILAEKLKLTPQLRDDVACDELASYFGSPVLLRLNNGNWVLFFGLRKKIDQGQSEERFAVYDPLSKTPSGALFLPRESLEKAWSRRAIFLKVERAGCSIDGRQTALYCLTALVKHYGGDTEVNRLVHTYAVSEAEPARHLLRKMADDLEFKTKTLRVKWEKLPGLGRAYPLMAFRKDGSAVILGGVKPLQPPAAQPAVETTAAEIEEKEKKALEAPAEETQAGSAGNVQAEKEKTLEAPVVTENGSEKTTKEKASEAVIEVAEPKKDDLGYELAVWDPVSRDGHRPEMHFINRETYEEQYSGEVLLFKRRYSLTDENQPFGLRWFLPEFIRQRTLLTQVAIAILAVSMLGLAVPLFFQLVVDKVLVHESFNTLTVVGTVVILVIAFDALLGFLQKYFLLYATNRIDIRLAVKTFAKLLSLPVDFYERIASGILIKHMQQTEKIRSFLSGTLFFSVLELLSLVVFLPVLYMYSPKLTGVVLLFTFLMALVIAVLIKPFQVRLEELYLAEGKRQGMLVETIHGIRTVKSLALEPTQQRKWNDTAAFAITRYFRVAKISMTAQTLSALLEKLMFVAIVWIGANAVIDKSMSVGCLIAFQMLSGRVTGPLVHIIGLVHEYQQTALSVRMLGVVMNCPGERVGGSLHHKLNGEISIENVNFQYAPDGPRVIKDFNLHIPPGTTVGLVGRSGSGKTTLTKLIQGLYPLQGGIIKYDGIDLREIDRASLRSSIGIVLQDNYFFHGTVRENLALTRKDATMEEIIYAARMAGADEFVQTLPRGYESILEENASNLSGGQRQRLAIARALLPNPRILIFDEATSALDPESETLVRRNLKLIARNRTVFIISHRLSVLCRADKIVVMDKGRLIEEGTHRELLNQKGIYAEFWEQQMGFDENE